MTDGVLAPGPSQEATPAQTSPPLWRNRDYLLLWGGQAVSTVGDGMLSLALPLFVLDMTHSPALAGLVDGMYIIAYVVLSLPAGALVDRWDRKRTMILCDAARGLLLLGVVGAAALGDLTVAQLAITGFASGACFVFFNLAEVASLPRVVGAGRLPAAMGQNQATVAAGNIISQAGAGALYAIGRMVPFAADAITFVASVGTLLLIRTPFQHERTARPIRLDELRAEIAEGFAWLWRHPVLRPITLLNGANNFVSQGFSLVLIVIARQAHMPTPILGLIFAASGVGGILGALAAPRLRRWLRLGRAIALALWVATGCWLLLAYVHGPLALAGVVVGVSVLNPLYNVVIISYRVGATPDELQGRVNGVARMFSNSLSPLGVLFTGVVLQAIQPMPTIYVVVACKAVIALAATLNRGIRSA
jgi:predicted MFS family arabinose efflux permease